MLAAAARSSAMPCRSLAAALVLLLLGCAHGGARTAPAPPPHPQAASPDRGDVDLNIPPSRLSYLPAGETAGERGEGPRTAAARRERRARPKAAYTGMAVGLLAGATLGAAGASEREARPITTVIGGFLGIWIGYLVGAAVDMAHGDFQLPVPPLPETRREYPDP